MTQNKNKLQKMEEELWNIKTTKDSLLSAMNPLVLWLEEMWRSFVSVFGQWKWVNKISIEMDRFENKILKNLKI